MHRKGDRDRYNAMKAIDQVIFFIISISSFLWIAVNLTGHLLYR